MLNFSLEMRRKHMLKCTFLGDVMKIILNLGDICQQNQMKALRAFANLLNPGDPNSMIPQLMALITGKDCNERLEKLKMGNATENEFIDFMITKLTEISSKTNITSENFTLAWNSMNASFEEFKTRLQEVISLQAEGHEIVFVSYTNPLDIKAFEQELSKGEISFETTEAGALQSVDGIRMLLSYVEKKSRLEMLCALVAPNTSQKAPTLFPPAQEEWLYITKEGKPSMAKSDVNAAEQEHQAQLPQNIRCIIWNKDEALKDLVSKAPETSLPMN